MPGHKCIVQGCPNKTPTGNLCRPCTDALTTGVVPKTTKSFLKAIPWMRAELIRSKSTVLSPTLSSNAKIAKLKVILKDVEADG